MVENTAGEDSSAVFFPASPDDGGTDLTALLPLRGTLPDKGEQDTAAG